MHSRIFELSDKPVPADERFSFEDVPEWFFATVADYADDILSAADRSEEIAWLVSTFHALCERDGDKLTLSPDTRKKFFRSRYSEFLEIAPRLAAYSYEAFCGETGSVAIETDLFRLKDAYDDQCGFYVYNRETCELHTLHFWLRRADLSKPYYVGGVIDYPW